MDAGSLLVEARDAVTLGRTAEAVEIASRVAQATAGTRSEHWQEAVTLALQALVVRPLASEDMDAALASCAITEPAMLPWEALIAWLTIHIRLPEQVGTAEEVATMRLQTRVELSPQQAEALLRFVAVDILAARGSRDVAEELVRQHADTIQGTSAEAIIECIGKRMAQSKEPSVSSPVTPPVPEEKVSTTPGLFPPPAPKQSNPPAPATPNTTTRPLGVSTADPPAVVVREGRGSQGPPVQTGFASRVASALLPAIGFVQEYLPQITVGTAVLFVCYFLFRLSRNVPAMRRWLDILMLTMKQALFFR